MDPPEEDDVHRAADASSELASLIEEAAGDRGVSSTGSSNVGVGHLELEMEAPDGPTDAPASASPPSASSSSFSGRWRGGGGGFTGGGSRKTVERPRPSPASSPSNNASADGGIGESSSLLGLSSRSRIVLLLMTLAAFVLLLVIIISKTEDAVEADRASTTYGVLHDRSRWKFGGSKTDSKSNNSKKGGKKRDGNYIGFHDPSLQNIYGANRYYKPPGVGFPMAPRGGLHPIYMLDFTEEEINDQLEKYDYGDLFDDDPETSPYADLRLKLTEEGREAEQKAWSEKLDEIREEYGYWDFRDDYKEKHKKERPRVDWATVGNKKEDYDARYGEIDKGDFPKDSWQTDDEYVSKFIKEGKALVKRMLDGIADEYGWETEAQRGGISIPDASTPEGKMRGGKVGVAWMYEKSFLALAKKLLNAMITNDHFFVTLGGHSAAAGHGNNFWQSYMLEFQRVMEPVFDRLGMVLVSANRAQGGMGTLQASLAGKSIYGENDVVLWDSSMTEKDIKPQDVFFRQALISGQRVPILFDMGGGKGMIDRIHREAGAHVGGINNNNFNPKFKDANNAKLIGAKYNAACWTERVDVTSENGLPVQYPGFGGQKSWHPGNWVHQSTARKISLVFLHALDEALAMWEKAAAEDGGNPLDGKHWHLQAEEDAIRAKVTSADATKTECGKIMNFLPRICTTPMRGAEEWSPLNDPVHNRIIALTTKPSPSGYVPMHWGVQEQMYPGRDPLMPSQRVPMGEVDVWAIGRSLPKGYGGSKSESGGERRRRSRSLSSARRGRQQRDDQNHALVTATNNTLSGARTDRSLRRSQYSSQGRRSLDGNDETEIVPGEGWAAGGHPAGYCDGTLNAICYREKSAHCMMSSHNDARGYMRGDALSGWIVFRLKDVTSGIFLARMEHYHDHGSNGRTKGWTTVNNATKEKDEDGRRDIRRRDLKGTILGKYEVAVNGVVIKRLNHTNFESEIGGHWITYNNGFYVLWNDEEWAKQGKKEDVEVAFRVYGEHGRNAVMAFTHVYYA